MKFKNLLLTAFFATALVACSNDDEILPSGEYDNGVIILNEGSYGNSNASVSFLPEDLSAIQHNIFSATNGSPLGDVAESIGFTEDEAFIVVNNSGKIEVVDRYSFESISTISEGLISPRYFTAANGKGYVTDWGEPSDPADDFVAVINLENYTVESSIPVSEGPEEIVSQNGKIFVSHQGGWNSNNIVTVLEGTQTTEITVHDNPDEMIFDENGKLWVLSEGYFDWEGGGADSMGALTRINPETNEIEQVLPFELPSHPSLMTFDNGKIYYSVDNQIFEMETGAASLPTEPILEGMFYGIKAHEGQLFATDAVDFASQGELLIFDLNTYAQVASFNAGIVPSKVYFN